MELRPSGAEVMLRIAAPLWLADKGFHAILATGAHEGSYANSLRNVGFQVFSIPFRKSFGYFSEVYSLIRRHRFTAVHIHTEQANVFYGLVARLAGVSRVVHTVHNVFPFTGTLRLVRIAMRKGLKLLGITAVSVGRSVSENEEFHLRNRTLTIPNWFDSSVFRLPSAEERAAARAAYGIDDRPVCLTLGNCNDWKNHSLLLRALQVLRETNDHWLYLHAGAEEEEKSERALAQQLGILSQCSFLGPVAEPQRLLWAADFFVMPSKREGFSIAAIEAAACGLPLILTDVPGLRDLKATMADALWAPLEPGALAQAIQLAFQRFSFRSESNAASAQEHFSVEVGASAYSKLYAGAQPLPLPTGAR
jgi:glycosyltransferase involved in cell wall biosynthesis